MNTFVKIASVLLMAVSLLGAQIAQAQSPEGRKPPEPPVFTHLPDYAPGIRTDIVNDKIRFTVSVHDMWATGRLEKMDVAGYIFTDGSMDLPTKKTKPFFETKVLYNGANDYYTFDLDASRSVRVCVWIDRKNRIDEVVGGDANNIKCTVFAVIQLDQSATSRTVQYLGYGNEPKPSVIDHFYNAVAHWLPLAWTKEVADISMLNVQPGHWLHMLPDAPETYYTHEYVLTITPAAEAAGWHIESGRWYYQ